MSPLHLGGLKRRGDAGCPAVEGELLPHADPPVAVLQRPDVESVGVVGVRWEVRRVVEEYQHQVRFLFTPSRRWWSPGLDSITLASIVEREALLFAKSCNPAV